MPTPDSIKKLVDHFAALSADARQPRFNETQTRREFIDPFFEALGWDVSNRAGYSETYKDVIHEDALAVEGRSRAPDYAFRVGGRRVFFVEAKKPSVNLSEEQAPAFQLRRYAWTAKLPISILTDFEELAVYDCRIKPAQTDKPTTGRLMLLNYRDYISHWDELYARFSKEAVLRGDFDAYAETSRGKKGAADVDDDFLATIEGWRKALALNLALRNPGLNERDLNYAVQMTIDRILFLRIAEERGIERADQLKDIAGEAEIYPGLVQLFRLADQRYNSGLFHFSAEKGRGTHADTLTPALKVDDRVLKEIIRGLYYPVCPYAWYVLPAEILGQVYEQFLGRVIRLTPGHQAKVEEKPEVRKAGGVYYTPGYIVDYIVQQTVGQLLEGRTPAEAARLKIVDPACGSGSFLLGAYQHLLNWHLNWYTSHDPQSHARGACPAVFETRQGWALTTGRKKEILLNSIHGVDIDPQAVEVTKLSLLLKVLEGDLPAAETQLGLGLERMLPDLGSNIQCGNSLIGPDYYANRQLGLGLVDDAEQYRVNAFDWQRAFPQVFAAGGFDAVIGNPPYIRIQALKEWAPTEVDYYKQRYKAASKGNYDIYVVFVEKGLDLLKATGRLGFILPHKFFNAQYGEPLRGLISAGKHLAKVVHFGDQQVFENATTYTCLMFLDKTASRSVEVEKVTDLAGWRNGEPGVIGAMADIAFTAAEWNISIGNDAGLFERLSQMPNKLIDVTSRIFQGIKTSADKIYIVEELERQPDKVRVFSREKNLNTGHFNK
ncbi:MAG TPA: Eco57I restriction-modification methylase domain-containing protein [Anaerolineaceae bacterium]|nr:Eco57I restriction-modification methylase domain-containing protein [Anaerolineaceae bacterium]HPN52027.1 Eco57I restriction-modification methylase domain-containing protein [Anaerolineaceae bacterium]